MNNLLTVIGLMALGLLAGAAVTSVPSYPPFMSGHAVAALASHQGEADREFDAMDESDAAAGH